MDEECDEDAEAEACFDSCDSEDFTFFFLFLSFLPSSPLSLSDPPGLNAYAEDDDQDIATCPGQPDLGCETERCVGCIDLMVVPRNVDALHPCRVQGRFLHIALNAISRTIER